MKKHVGSFPIILSAPAFAVLVFVSGCTPKDVNKSSVKIQMPTENQLRAAASKNSKGVGSLAVMNTSSICFFVNATGPGLDQLPQDSCDIKRGVISKGAGPGATIEMEVAVGDNRTFEVYSFQRTGSSCEIEIPKPLDLSKHYLLGKTTNQKIVSPMTEPVIIAVSIPDSSATLLASQSWPAACVMSQSQSRQGARVQVAAGVMTSSSYKVQARVSEKPEEKTLSGSTYKIKGWMNP